MTSPWNCGWLNPSTISWTGPIAISAPFGRCHGRLAEREAERITPSGRSFERRTAMRLRQPAGDPRGEPIVLRLHLGAGDDAGAVLRLDRIALDREVEKLELFDVLEVRAFDGDHHLIQHRAEGRRRRRNAHRPVRVNRTLGTRVILVPWRKQSLRARSRTRWATATGNPR